ncbi:hypothetical protein DICPUDRAFT_149795 [Dictyostelium purpureum]|uniref:Uncharacterized protein n=1 Tax=Dictyostelium purpureum TaxID=5786 RepID=F0ZEP4_DICPU|nr:uncharacterized protein DICPUDRAFT_149795 [Dictyostelium purpureum]EGC37576.1 hypothetical protein DICPUDRAFT_149795 [Dictyostelium purpureum]|eukprot:XP_003285902.1 hypothetical protein DICPUDRAFT_149795 [Dictyostelium purpureum]
MDSNFEFFDYKNYNKKNICIKELISKKLKIESSQFEIEALEDIASISQLFSKEIPFSNFELIGGNLNFDIDTIVNCIQNKGGRCLHLNIALGLLLTEFGIKVHLVKAIEESPYNIYDIFRFHYGNVFKWRDGRYYFHDVGLGYFNHYYPIEIGNETPIEGYSKSLPPSLFRVIENNNNNYGPDKKYILQKKLINNNTQEENDFISVFEFKFKEKITFQAIIERSSRFIKSPYCFPVASILREEGYYFLANNSLTIFSPSNSKSITKINDIEQFEMILLKHFNLDIRLFKFFKKEENHFECQANIDANRLINSNIN